MNKAAFLDRDGVINEKAPSEDEYITRWEDMHFLRGAAEAINLLNRVGFRVIVVSNQRCVAKGLLTSAELDSLHQRMRRELSAMDAQIDAVYHCPHDEHPPCGCRKPQPGMLVAAANEHEIDLPSSWMIGDSEKDIEAGKRAGCKTARIAKGDAGTNGRADVLAESLLDAVQEILRLEEIASDSRARSAPNSVRCS
jgi:D-glycero-D-manno-heptose 1,7-bisphosphate phosphatase